MDKTALRRILVANRGEIARRIIRGAHDAGCEAVAVFAADDAGSPHVGEADAAVLLPGASLRETYLDADALVAAARASGSDALHPGYGFLSENPALAEACAREGIVWVGPPAEAMRVMGHKTRAKTVAAAAGVPVLPSAVVPSGAEEAALAVLARGVGYPLLVKASAGGGGRGMRLVEEPGGLAEAVAAAQREAAAAFGSDEVFVERYLTEPRHIEVQVVGDTHGTVVHLFDRECSVQRRHQKVVEEAPAALVPDATRHAMWEAAVAAAQAVGYVGAGTVEYLVDTSGFYFLEMNTRLQVEHGVTELVTGLDLVGLQLSVASGRALPFSQDDVASSGHAIEVRVCAESPRDGYRPTPGTATHVGWPQGAGVRVDSAIESGSVVSPAYDSLVAKVMTHGADRSAAVAKLSLALRTLELDGLETNRELLQAVLDDAAFRRGGIDIHYLDRRSDLRDALVTDEVRRRHAAAAGFSLLEERAARSLVPVPAAGWRNVGRPLHVDELRDATGTIEVRVTGPGEPAELRVEGGEWQSAGSAAVRRGVVDLLSPDGLRRRYRVRLGPHAAFVNGPEGQSTFVLRTEDDAAERGGVAGECRAPLPGAVTKVLVSVGDVVDEGDGLVVLEAMKMEHTLRAPGAGTVRAVHGAPGQQVDVGDLLVEMDPA
ncbi:MAG TPA: biotin carboxylase N-terminal domain-containing protein [Acidimicrobiales bacterium]|jgi:propionyl-CoA carboxylase alpha chain|nr:biotin carboxylase N-terminal domain-containing protein [Acidimicrobiales bacterium]